MNRCPPGASARAAPRTSPCVLQRGRGQREAGGFDTCSLGLWARLQVCTAAPGAVGRWQKHDRGRVTEVAFHLRQCTNEYCTGFSQPQQAWVNQKLGQYYLLLNGCKGRGGASLASAAPQSAKHKRCSMRSCKIMRMVNYQSQAPPQPASPGRWRVKSGITAWPHQAECLGGQTAHKNR